MEDKVKDPHDNHGECEGDHKVEVGVSRDKSSASWCRTEWADHKPFVRRSTPSDKQMRIVWKKKQKIGSYLFERTPQTRWACTFMVSLFAPMIAT